MNKTITYKNYNINCQIEGEGQVVLFLHGWPTNSALWSSQIDLFKANYQTIAIDWLGFGASDKPIDHHYTFTQKKETLDAVLPKLIGEEKQITIVAHDVGGPAAILWVNENQKRVKQLILLNTVLFPFSTFLDKISHTLFQVPILKNSIASPFGLNTLMRTLVKNGEGKARIKEILKPYDTVSSELKLKTILEPVLEGLNKELHTLAGKFKALQVEKYLIMAAKDPLCYAHIKKLSEANPDVPAYELPHCGHYIPIDQPTKLNEILLEIIGQPS